MKITRTIKLKLNIPESEILSTVQAYTKAYNLICQQGWQDKDYNAISLHHKTYKNVRKQFNLPAQLAISARTKATESLKSVRSRIIKKQKATQPNSKQCSIRYDKNSITIWFDKEKISLLTVNGRKKYSIRVPDYFKQYITWNKCSAELMIRNHTVFLNITVSTEKTDIPQTDTYVGIDRGIKKIAVTSEKQFFNGSQIKRITDKYEKNKSKLQSKGTKSAKRHLKKLSKKVNRFRRDVNHCIAKQIVKSVKPGSTIILEDLAGIRQNVRLRKKQRTELNKWNFYQFEQFLKYKAEEKGIKVEHVSARYTSQKCSKCGYISRSNRKSQSQFKCTKCSYQLNADLNAAFNIKKNYLDSISYLGRVVVNQPIVTSSV
jgi:putative transposase